MACSNTVFSPTLSLSPKHDTGRSSSKFGFTERFTQTGATFDTILEVKQRLRIRSFADSSENAGMIRVHTALTVSSFLTYQKFLSFRNFPGRAAQQLFQRIHHTLPDAALWEEFLNPRRRRRKRPCPRSAPFRCLADGMAAGSQHGRLHHLSSKPHSVTADNGGCGQRMGRSRSHVCVQGNDAENIKLLQPHKEEVCHSTLVPQ